MNATMMNIALIYADRLEFENLYARRDERLDLIEAAIRHHGFNVTRIDRKSLPDSLEEFDLVVAAGGDGTQLDAAVRLQTKPLCAVRLFPEKSVGYHCTIDYTGIDAFMNALSNHSHRTIKVPRLQALLDGTPVAKPVLNDILVAHPCPARASKYAIQFNGVSETHCSSGIWIATPPGSHGAAHSAGTIPIDDTAAEMAVFQVRELASPNAALKSCRFIPDKDSLEIQCLGTPLMLWFDGGIQSVPFMKGQTLTFSYQACPLAKWTL
ncbi:MAG: NAD(+)/NADH kinase [Proteobacteria bacterium]|nr:NAD(+)/NADH kinase [Pseudomonadota bacterium]